ncbi:hypothetical protein M527_18020 [Sphingobium indicum IP26]|nr:hypothetical protein M527_18020 [Sphingobium indicum IP26]
MVQPHEGWFASHELKVGGRVGSADRRVRHLC